jgi:hypothetical protein
VAAQAVLEPQTGALENLRVQVAPVVDDDEHRRAGSQLGTRVRKRADHAVDVGGWGGTTSPARRRAELELSHVVEAEQLVRVAVLLVVVDQARIRRRGEDAVEAAAEVELPSVAVEDGRLPATGARAGELADARDRVERVATEEVRGAVDRTALAPVLVAPVRLALRRPRGVEVEVGCQPGGAGRAGEDDREHVRVLVLARQLAEPEQLGDRPRRVPGADELGSIDGRLVAAGVEPRERVANLMFEREDVVAPMSSRA